MSAKQIAIAVGLCALFFPPVAHAGTNPQAAHAATEQGVAAQAITPTPAEQILLDAAREGRVADYSSRDTAANDPTKGSAWSPERTIRAEIIYALATGSDPAWPVHPKGIQITGARITGQLDFGYAEIKYPMTLARCYIEKPIILTRAMAARSIALTGSYVVIAIGCFVFWNGGRAQLFRESNGGGIQRQSHDPFLYSLDVFLPFVGLHQKSRWVMAPRGRGDWAYYLYEIWYVLETVAGSAITGLAAAWLSGLIGKSG